MTGRAALEDLETGRQENPEGRRRAVPARFRQSRSGGLSRSPGRASTSPGRMCGRCRSAAVFTSASAPSLPESRPRWRLRHCCGGYPISSWTTPKIRNGGRASCCAASNGCPPAGKAARGKPPRDFAVTSPHLPLYMIYGAAPALRSARRRVGRCGPPSRRNMPKGRRRADDAARIGDCLHPGAACRADRAVLRRLEPVPAAIRGRGDTD